LEPPELKLVHVEPAGEFWICGEKNLKTAVEAKTVDSVGADSATNTVGCL
jgi:hypothetical protein